MLSAIIVLSVYCLAVWLPELLLLHAAYKRSHLLRCRVTVLHFTLFHHSDDNCSQ